VLDQHTPAAGGSVVSRQLRGAAAGERAWGSAPSATPSPTGRSRPQRQGAARGPGAGGR
jgi:hypothetical protein